MTTDEVMRWGMPWTAIGLVWVVCFALGVWSALLYARWQRTLTKIAERKAREAEEYKGLDEPTEWIGEGSSVWWMPLLLVAMLLIVVTVVSVLAEIAPEGMLR